MVEPGCRVVCITHEPWTTLGGNFQCEGPAYGSKWTVGDVFKSVGSMWVTLAEWGEPRGWDAQWFQRIPDPLDALRELARIEPALEPV